MKFTVTYVDNLEPLFCVFSCIYINMPTMCMCVLLCVRFGLVQKTGSSCSSLAFALHRCSEFLVGMADCSLKCFDAGLLSIWFCDMDFKITILFFLVLCASVSICVSIVSANRLYWLWLFAVKFFCNNEYNTKVTISGLYFALLIFIIVIYIHFTHLFVNSFNSKRLQKTTKQNSVPSEN